MPHAEPQVLSGVWDYCLSSQSGICRWENGKKHAKAMAWWAEMSTVNRMERSLEYSEGEPHAFETLEALFTSPDALWNEADVLEMWADAKEAQLQQHKCPGHVAAAAALQQMAAQGKGGKAAGKTAAAAGPVQSMQPVQGNNTMQLAPPPMPPPDDTPAGTPPTPPGNPPPGLGQAPAD